MTDKYILEGTKVVPCDDLLKWGQWFGDIKNRIVKQEQVGQYRVSTVFIGLDHQFGDGPPLVFETMVFEKGRNEKDCERYSAYDEALAGHEAMVQKYSEIN